MPDIRGALNDIDKQIKDLKADASAASKAVREIGQELRFDTSNVDLVRSKYEQLGKQLQIDRDLLDAYKRKEEELKTALASETDVETKKQLAKELENTQRAADKAASEIERLTAATSKLAQNTDYAKAKTEQLKQGFETAEKTARSFATAALAVVAALGVLVKQSIETGIQLYALSKQYNANVEDIQDWNNKLYVATGQSELYNKALSVMTKGMAQFAAGRGVAYAQALKNIGLSATELSKLSTTEQFDKIFNALMNVGDATERAAAAQTLFGDSGLLIANVAGLGAEEIAKLDEATEDFAIISGEAVENLVSLNLKLQETKSQLSEASAEVTIALTPAILALSDIIVDYVAPALKTLADGFEALGPTGQKVVVVLLAIIIALPKIIAFVKILTTAIAGFKAGIVLVTNSTAALNIVTAQWQLVLLAVAAVIIAIIALLATFSKSAKEAQTAIEGTLSGAKTVLGGEFGELSANTETYNQNISEKTVTINAEIYGHGDTQVSDESAQQVAILTVDEINKALGGLI